MYLTLFISTGSPNPQQHTQHEARSTAFDRFDHAIGRAVGQRGVWGYVRGGMGAITQALAASGRKLGVEIPTSAPVANIDVRDGRIMKDHVVSAPRSAADDVLVVATSAASADRRIALEELRMLDAIRRLLDIDKLTAAAIERGARAKYQVA